MITANVCFIDFSLARSTARHREDETLFSQNHFFSVGGHDFSKSFQPIISKFLPRLRHMYGYRRN